MEVVRYEFFAFHNNIFGKIKHFLKSAKKNRPRNRAEKCYYEKNYGFLKNQTKDNNNTKPKKEKFSGLRKKANSPRR